MSKTLEELHEAPRVLAAIVEEIAAEPRPRLLVERRLREEQPLELETGRGAVGDGESVVGELRQQGGEHALEAEAAAEIRMVHGAPYDGEQIDDALRHSPQAIGIHRKLVGHALDAPALEARVVGGDGARRLAGREQPLGERGARVRRPRGEPLVVTDTAVGILNMTAELHRHGVVGMAAVPHGNRQGERFEVEKGHRRLELLQGGAQALLHDHAARLHGASLAILDGLERHVVGQIVNARVPLLLEEERAPPRGVERAHVMRRTHGPAPREERALIRRAAVLADAHIGPRSREHRTLLVEEARHRLPRGTRRFRHLAAYEEIAQVGMGARAIEVHDLESLHVHSGAVEHVRLQRDVGQMLLLDPRGALHLHDGESGRRTLQDVHRHEHGVGTKGRLVDDLRTASHRLLGSGEALRVGPIGQVDEDPAGNIGTRRRAHPRAIVEERLGEVVGQKLWRFGLVHRPPQPLVALQARHHTRLGETDRSGRHGASIGQLSTCRNAPRERQGLQKKLQGIALSALPFFCMSTRGLAPSVAALAVVLSLASPARGASPTQTLQGFFGKANVILATVDPMRSLDEPRRAVRELVDQVFDYQEAAELVLGPVWETRTPDQRTELGRPFADFLERGSGPIIAPKPRVSSGVTVQYVGESVEGDAATVSTTVLTRSGGEMPVDYSMIRGEGRWLVRDVIIEGVSLIANYRAQFARVIRTSSYAALIAKM